MIKIKQAIVVEGRYDKNTLRQIVDAPIFETSGFGIMHDQKMVQFLRHVAKTRGLIILTDSDGAGFVIRNHLKSVLPRENVFHAYIPDVYGKEKRKQRPGKEGKLGVEGMPPEVLLQALRRAGVALEETAQTEKREEITKADLFRAGLSGRPDSKQRRDMLLQQLQLPAHLSSNALLEALNIIYSRTQFLQEFGE